MFSVMISSPTVSGMYVPLDESHFLLREISIFHVPLNSDIENSFTSWQTAGEFRLAIESAIISDGCGAHGHACEQIYQTHSFCPAINPSFTHPAAIARSAVATDAYR